MNKNYIIGILVIALIIVGGVAIVSSMKSAPAAPAVATVNVNTQAANDMANSGWMPSASFMCKDKTHFIAEFPSDSLLSVVVDGKVVANVPRISGLGQQYEDPSFTFVFAGEEATVVNKATKKTTTCTQPFDANNAPVNFGDTGEGGGTKPDLALIVSQSIVAGWQSNQDPKFIREFMANGTVSDLYDNKVVSTGKWVAFTSEKLPPVKLSFPLEKDAVYVQMTTTKAPAETLDFRVNKITPDVLELTYMEKGGTNTFRRIKQ